MGLVDITYINNTALAIWKYIFKDTKCLKLVRIYQVYTLPDRGCFAPRADMPLSAP